MNAIVVAKVQISESLLILRIAPIGWEIPSYFAGQYAMIGLPSTAQRWTESGLVSEDAATEKLITRSYSAAGFPDNRESVEFLITLVPEGALSPRVFALEVGDKIWMSKNLNGFFSLERVPEDANLLVLATGSGLSACIGMIRSTTETLAHRKIALVHGSRFSRELAYRAELELLARVSDNFTYINCISRPETEASEWHGRSGYVQDILRSGDIDDTWGFHPSPDNTHIFVSGNPAMCEAVSQKALEEGFIEQTYKQPGTLHMERFW